MSGGHWEYIDSRCREEMFDYDTHTAQDARKQNPLKDPELSELLWDMFELIHTCDYYLSGDTGKAEYNEQVREFKDKWLNRDQKTRMDYNVEQELAIALERIKQIE